MLEYTTYLYNYFYWIQLVERNMVYINELGQRIDGARVEDILDVASITLNKNSVPGYMNFCFVYLDVMEALIFLPL